MPGGGGTRGRNFFFLSSSFIQIGRHSRIDRKRGGIVKSSLLPHLARSFPPPCVLELTTSLGGAVKREREDTERRSHGVFGWWRFF